MKRIFLLVLTLVWVISFSFAQKQKVIFDCDLGGDIDDAFALGLLLNCREEFDILGITMDHGETMGRARIACKMLYLTGLEEIPVYVGRPTPGIVGTDKEIAGPSNQYMWAQDFTLLKPQEKPAADFIIESLDKYPGEIILFTVGPVPTIGDVLDRRPDILKKARRVVSMFGSFYVGYDGSKPCPEWNVKADISSARKLLASGADLTFAGLDVTDHVILEQPLREWLLWRQSPLTISLTQLLSFWYKQADWAQRPKMFDPVALGMVLWPDLFETKKVHVTINNEGMTLIDPQGKPNCTIGTSIKKDEFLERMMKKIIWQTLEGKCAAGLHQK